MSSTVWYCGHCHYGPMKTDISDHCVICFHQRDIYARYEDLSTSSTSARAAALLPPTAYPNASISENLPLDSSKLECSSTTVGYQGETPSDSIPRHGQPTGYLSDSKGLGRGQTCCPQPAQTGWYCCQCKPLYTLILLFEANGRKVATALKTKPPRSSVSNANTPGATVVLEVLETNLFHIWGRKGI